MKNIYIGYLYFCLGCFWPRLIHPTLYKEITIIWESPLCDNGHLAVEHALIYTHLFSLVLFTFIFPCLWHRSLPADGVTMRCMQIGAMWQGRLAEARAVSAFVDTRGRVAHVKAINWKMCK